MFKCLPQPVEKGAGGARVTQGRVALVGLQRNVKRVAYRGEVVVQAVGEEEARQVQRVDDPLLSDRHTQRPQVGSVEVAQVVAPPRWHLR